MSFDEYWGELTDPEMTEHDNFWLSPMGELYVANYYDHGKVMEHLQEQGVAPREEYGEPDGWVRISSPNRFSVDVRTSDVNQKQFDTLFDLARFHEDRRWSKRLMDEVNRLSTMVRNPLNPPSPWWLLTLPAAGVVGAGVWWLFGGDKVVLYDRSVGEAVHLAREYFPGWNAHGFSSVADVQRAIRTRGRIKRFVIISHGGPDWFYSGDLSAQSLASWLAPKLTLRSVVSLAGCSAGRSPSEPAVWDAAAFGPGGADSYAGHLRDWLNEYGVKWGEVRAHSLAGHATGSPAGREFEFARRGEPGVGVMPVGYGWRQWVVDFSEEPAHNWIMGA